MPKPNLFDLSGQIALVTGAAGGLGYAIAEAMAVQGATAVLVDIDAERCQSAAERLQSAGLAAYWIACDITNRDAVQTMVVEVLTQYGQIDVLVCNAGIQGPAGPSGDITDADWDRVMTTNLQSALWLSKFAIPAMAERGSGSVILMSSIAGLRGNRTIGLYGISKAGLAQLARNLAVEWGPAGVRVNTISPGLIRTSLATELLKNETFMERRLAITPLRRVGEPHEVAGVAVMLASTGGAFITGQNLVVDGGTVISD